MTSTLFFSLFSHFFLSPSLSHTLNRFALVIMMGDRAPKAQKYARRTRKCKFPNQNIYFYVIIWITVGTSSHRVSLFSFLCCFSVFCLRTFYIRRTFISRQNPCDERGRNKSAHERASVRQINKQCHRIYPQISHWDGDGIESH